MPTAPASHGVTVIPSSWMKSSSHPSRIFKPRREGAPSWPSRSFWEHEHFEVADLIFREEIQTSFRIYLYLGIGKTRLDCSDGLGFVGNGYKE